MSMGMRRPPGGPRYNIMLRYNVVVRYRRLHVTSVYQGAINYSTSCGRLYRNAPACCPTINSRISVRGDQYHDHPRLPSGSQSFTPSESDGVRKHVTGFVWPLSLRAVFYAPRLSRVCAVACQCAPSTMKIERDPSWGDEAKHSGSSMAWRRLVGMSMSHKRALELYNMRVVKEEKHLSCRCGHTGGQSIQHQQTT